MKGFRNYGLAPSFFDPFDDLDKLVLLNQILRNRSGSYVYHQTKEEYTLLVYRFYFCERFNLIYKNWIESGKKPHLKPSIDHIIPISKGGDNSIANLKILNFMQNRAKGNLDENEWQHVLNNLEKYFY